MELLYEFKISDLLEYQLYSTYKSKTYKNRHKLNQIILPAIYLFFGISIINLNETLTGVGFIIFAILWFLLYPSFLKKRYKKILEKNLKEKYENVSDKKVSLLFDKDYIFAKDFMSESKIKTSELLELVEVNEYFFIILKTKQSIVIPKDIITDRDEFLEIIKGYNIEIIKENTNGNNAYKK